MVNRVPQARIVDRNDRPVRRDGSYVLYWMTAARRATWNFALDRALEWGRELGRPVLVFEGLRSDHEWAGERIRRFVTAGMGDNRSRLDAANVRYYSHVEESPGSSKGLLEALARDACVVVGDEFPCFFLPRMIEAAASRLSMRLETVDGNGLLPLRASPDVFKTAYSFRRFLQRELPAHLDGAPRVRPPRQAKRARVPRAVLRRWPEAMPRGTEAAATAVAGFLRSGARPSGLSAHLHFGHVSSHELFQRVAKREDWHAERLGRANGARRGWWGMSEATEEFLDQLVTWRELGYHNCLLQPDLYHRYESLPEWARATLADHAKDARPHLYTLEQFEDADTHDELWNAAQRQLVREGAMHGYLRMLWGKKILEWSPSPEDAFRTMVELNNRYALDGRDPNSYSGIAWVLGRYDRPWGPERAVFGKVRYMSSRNTRRKLRLAEYLERYGG